MEPKGRIVRVELALWVAAEDVEEAMDMALKAVEIVNSDRVLTENAPSVVIVEEAE